MKYISILLFCFIALSVLVPLNLSVAQDCPPSGAPTSTICNPVPGWFISYNDNTAGGVIFRIIQILLTIVGLISMLFIIIGGFQYITSRGNEEQADAGKRTLNNAIIGLVIVILSYVIVVVTINALRP